MGEQSNSELPPESQPPFETAEFTCPSCHEVPDAIEEMGNTIALRPCDHEFRHTDLTTVFEHLRALDDLIQRHDSATTPLERQGLREEIHAVGTELDAAADRCRTHSNQ